MAFFERFPDAEKASRRFIDFVCKEIENLHIKNYLEENNAERDFILANVFNLRSTQYLFEYYHEKAAASAKETEMLWMTMELMGQQVKWHTKGQMKEDMMQLRALLRQKYEYTNLNYYQQLAQHYSAVSALYIDDNQKENFFKDLLPEEAELLELVEKSPSPFLAAQFSLALARFNFRNEEKLNLYLDKTEALVALMDIKDIMYERAKRSIYYLRILSGIHYGAVLKKLIEYSSEIVRINQSHAYKDSVSFFLYLMLLLLDGQLNVVLSKRKKFDAFYFDETNSAYPDFLDALLYFIKNEQDEALQLLNNLSYAQSDYVALWSKLLVLKIHSDLGNERLLKNLIGRANSYLDQHKGKFFTYETSAKVLACHKAVLTGQKKDKNEGLFVFFQKLLP